MSTKSLVVTNLTHPEVKSNRATSTIKLGETQVLQREKYLIVNL